MLSPELRCARGSARRGRYVPRVQESTYEREIGYAERYRDRRFTTGTGRGTDRRERRALRALLQMLPAGSGPWLDAPSGAGRLTAELPGPGVRVDRDPAMVRAAGPDRPRACASVHALPFGDGSFRGVLCMRLLQHIGTADERVAILRELRRVAREAVLVSFFDSASLQHLRRRLRRVRHKRPSGRHAVGRAAFAAELRRAGLEPLRMHALRRFFGEQTLVLCRVG